MSRKSGSFFIIEGESDGVCELCGKIDELRPYGPNKENICFACGMKDQETTDRMLDARMNGPSEDTEH